MSVVLNGTSQFLYLASALAGGTPFTIFVWFKTTSDTLNQVIAAEDMAAVSGYKIHGALEASGNVASDPIRAYNYNGSSYGIAVSTSGYTKDTWQSACGIFTSATSRDAFVNGGSKGSNTDNIAGDSDEFVVGCRRSASPVGYFVGKIAHVAVWDMVLSDANVASLHGGANPLSIEQGNLIGYWTLYDDALATIGTDLSESGSPTYDTDDNPDIDGGLIHTSAYLYGDGSMIVTPSIFVYATANLSGLGNLTAYPSISNVDNIGHIIDNILYPSVPGWDTGCDQGSGDVWSNPKPELVGEIVGAGELGSETQQPMSQNDFDGSGIIDALEYPWYEDCHLLPRLIQDLGNIVSDQAINCDLYNADRNNKITITSVTNNLGTGIEVSGVPSTPFDIGSQESLLFTITVKMVGEFNFDASYTLHTATDDYTIYITGSRIVLFPYRPEAPFREHLLFDTRIIEKVDGSEQRIANRQYPRKMFEATYKNGQQYIEMLLFDRQAKVVAYPAWHEPSFVTGPVSAGALTVNVNTTNYANFYAGGYAVIIDDEHTYDALKIESMTATSLTFTSETSHSFSAKAQVMPLLTSYIEAASAAIKYAVNQEYFNLRIHVAPEVNDIASAAAWSTYSGAPFMDGPNLMEGGQLAEAIKTKVFVLDNITGLRTQETAWDHAKREGKKGWKTNSRQELWELRQLLNYLKGKQVGFYIPTFWKDLTVTQDMQVGTFVLNIENIGYVVNAQNRWPKNTIRIHFTDDTILVRTIQNSAVVSDTEEQLTLDAAWPSTKTPDDIKRVEFLEKVRLDVDDITIIHYNALGQAECIVPLKEINN